MSAIHRRELLAQICENLLVCDQESKRVLVFEEPGTLPGPTLFVKISENCPPDTTPDVFGFPAEPRRPFPMGVTKVHPSQMRGDRVGFDVAEAWRGDPVLVWPPSPKVALTETNG